MKELKQDRQAGSGELGEAPREEGPSSVKAGGERGGSLQTGRGGERPSRQGDRGAKALGWE